MADSALNAISINEATGDIVIACGATGYFKVEIETDGQFNTDTDVGVFAVGKKSGTRRERTYTTVLRRHYPIVLEGEGQYSVLVEIANEDTREVPADTGAVQQEPCILLKIGDGTTAFTDLPFVAGRAADVYSWAKAATKPSYTADEITGLADYIAGEIEDTDTQYQIVMDDSNDHLLKLQSKPKGGQSWTDAGSITLPDDSYNDTAITGRVSALETLVGDTAVGTQIATAISALDDVYDAKGAAAQALTDAKAYADGKDAAIAAAQSAADAAQDDVDALTTDVQANTSAIATLNGTGAGSVQKQVADAVAQIVAEAPEAYDTLKEISDWISSHSGDASEMNSAIQQNTADIGELETAVAGKVDKVSGKQLSTNDYTTTEKNKLSGIEAGAQVNVIETVQVNGSPVSPSGKTVNISMPTGALASKSEVAESDLASALASKINAKANTSDLAAVATSGSLSDLTQPSGDVIILYGGTATTVI